MPKLEQFGGLRSALVLAVLLVVCAPRKACAAHLRHSSQTPRRELRQEEQACGRCPGQDAATTACSALPSSVQALIRNNLISSCGTSISSSSNQGCCSSLTGPWEDYLNCLCAGDEIFAGLSAFVDTASVVMECGCGADGEAEEESGEVETSGSVSSTVGGSVNNVFVSSGGVVSSSSTVMSSQGESPPTTITSTSAENIPSTTSSSSGTSPAPTSAGQSNDLPPEDVQQLLALQESGK